MTPPPSKRSLPLQIASFVLTRWVLNVQVRMFYPFLAVFARGFGISQGELSLALTARGLAGAVLPFLAPLADRHGRKTGMLVGLGLFIASNVLVVSWSSYAVLILAVCLSMVGVFLVISSIQAHVGDSIPYEKRGLAIALTELGWSLSFILGMPLVGFLLARTNHRVPFWLGAALGLAAFILISRVVQPGDRSAAPSLSPGSSHIRRVLASPAALAALGVSFSITLANEVVNLMFGVWMEDAFQLNVLALGASSAVIGFSELFGEGLTALLADRLGKQWAVRIGLALNGLFALWLPWLGQSLTGALVGLFLFYLSFEFSVVSLLPLITEILPEGRATLLGANVAAFSLGRALGAFLAPRLYPAGFQANIWAALAFDLLGFLLLNAVRIQGQKKVFGTAP